MQINLTNTGHLPTDCPKVFYRVEEWLSGRRLADFSNRAEAHTFAVKHATEGNYKYGHRVCQLELMRLS